MLTSHLHMSSISVKSRHEIMSVMVLNDYFVFLWNIVEMQNDSAGFRRNFPNLIPEMKSARKITTYTYYSCIGDSSTYVNICGGSLSKKHQIQSRFAEWFCKNGVLRVERPKTSLFWKSTKNLGIKSCLWWFLTIVLFSWEIWSKCRMILHDSGKISKIWSQKWNQREKSPPHTY